MTVPGKKREGTTDGEEASIKNIVFDWKCGRSENASPKILFFGKTGWKERICGRIPNVPIRKDETKTFFLSNSK